MAHTNFFSYIRITAYQPSILTEQKYRFHCFRNVQKVQRNEVYIIWGSIWYVYMYIIWGSLVFKLPLSLPHGVGNIKLNCQCLAYRRRKLPIAPLHGAATRNSPRGSRGGPFNINIIILSQPFWPKTVVDTADTHAIDTHGTADTDAMWNSNEWWHNVL